MKVIDYEAFRKKSILAMVNAILLGDYDAARRIKEFIEVLEKEEKIEAEPIKRGRWEKRGGIAYCTNCNHSSGATAYPYYCSYCGVKMDSEPPEREVQNNGK